MIRQKKKTTKKQYLIEILHYGFAENNNHIKIARLELLWAILQEHIT